MKQTRNIIDISSILLKLKQMFFNYFFYFGISLSFSLLVYAIIMFFYNPVQCAASIVRFITFFTVYSTLCVTGFLFYRVLFQMGKSTKSLFIIIIQPLIIFGTMGIILLRPESGIYGIPELIKKIVISFVVFVPCGMAFGMVIDYLNRMNIRQKLFYNIKIAGNKYGLIGSIIIPVFVALPILIKPIVMWWDVSGWMDSHSYDTFAHQIVTGDAIQGNSFYMPLYQYGMAFFYYIFGHFFYIQQIVNVFMAYATIILLCLTAWNIFQKKWAVLLIGVWAAYTTQLHHAIYYTQIENWYIPTISLTLFAWSCYWRNPVKYHLIFLAVSIGLAFNTRTQGAFFFALLIFTPFFVKGIQRRDSIRHVLTIVFVVGSFLLPWSIRNYNFEHRFSPSSDQSIIQICVLNDRRVGLYGNRYDIGYSEVVQEYYKKYPDKNERMKVMKRDAIKNIFGDPVWLAKAVYWRTLAFYGLIPPGVWASEGSQPTDWRLHWKSYVYWGFTPLFLITVSLIGLLLRPCKTTIFLLFSILGNLGIVIFAAVGEPRVSYPVLPIHMLLGLCVFYKPVDQPDRDKWLLTKVLFSDNKIKYWIAGVFSMIVFLFLIHHNIGKHNIYRSLIEKSVIINDQVSIDEDLPSLNSYYEWEKVKSDSPPVFHEGEKVQLKVLTSNFMLPPKYGSGITWLPQFATDPLRETYYYAYIVKSGGYVGITYFGATTNTVIRENDIVNVEGTILLVDTENSVLPVRFWVNADKIVKSD